MSDLMVKLPWFPYRPIRSGNDMGPFHNIFHLPVVQSNALVAAFHQHISYFSYF
jgi:hypothetical protein